MALAEVCVRTFGDPRRVGVSRQTALFTSGSKLNDFLYTGNYPDDFRRLVGASCGDHPAKHLKRFVLELPTGRVLQEAIYDGQLDMPETSYSFDVVEVGQGLVVKLARDLIARWEEGPVPPGLVGPLERLKVGLSNDGVSLMGEDQDRIFQEPTGWAKVDRQLQGVRIRLASATNVEEFQGVGLLCREALISLAQEVYSPEAHGVLDVERISTKDVNRMLEAYLAGELGGASNEEARALAKAAVRASVALQHKRSADFRTAALAAEATQAVINIVSILAGRRGS